MKYNIRRHMVLLTIAEQAQKRYTVCLRGIFLQHTEIIRLAGARNNAVQCVRLTLRAQGFALRFSNDFSIYKTVKTANLVPVRSFTTIINSRLYYARFSMTLSINP